jgi:hypothetical protein
MFCWPCIIVYQYNETNVMHFSFNLLRIRGHLHVSSTTCSSSGGDTQTTFGILRAYNVSCSAVARLQLHCSGTATVPQHKQGVLETCRGTWFSLNWMKSASRWFHYTDINPLNAELNPICHLLALLGAHHILHVSRIRVKINVSEFELLFELTFTRKN